jgi:hypothetical protein
MSLLYRVVFLNLAAIKETASFLFLIIFYFIEVQDIASFISQFGL